MVKLDPTVTTVAAAAVVAAVLSVTLTHLTPGRISDGLTVSGGAQAADTAAPRPQWAASATGRVEPKGGEIRVSSEAPGKIEDVLAAANDRVLEGDLLVRLDAGDLYAKLSAAEAEALVRMRERDEEPVKGPALERRQAEDQLAASLRALFRARHDLDTAYVQLKDTGQGSSEALKPGRDKLSAAIEKVKADRESLKKLDERPDMPLPSRLESALTQARADVEQVENAIERMHVRAPSTGTVLTVWAKEGELASPSVEAPLVLFGDLSALRVRAEVEERDTPKLRVGQRVVVRAEAYSDRDFEGVVTQVGQALGPPRITTRGPRRPNDVEVLEVLVALDGNPPLLTGMRVDVFFRQEASASAGPTQ